MSGTLARGLEDSFKLFSTVEGYSASSERKSLSILKAATCGRLEERSVILGRNAALYLCLTTPVQACKPASRRVRRQAPVD